jgi:predicted dehydrogenase
MHRMRFAIIGVGFVADMYMTTFKLHPQLELAGAYDRDAARLTGFAKHYNTSTFPSLEALLADKSVDCIVNLTNPSSHYELNKAALLAGKHVHCEKPLAMTYEQAAELVELAAQRGLQLSSAPVSVLSESCQTMAKAIRENAVGTIRAVYAEMDDGLVHRMPYRKWLNERGIPWPYVDEFEVGCTLEHAGYSLTWLLGFFGPATSVTSFASVQIPDKALPEVPPEKNAPDFSVACVQFANGVVARLTCSIIAPHDHALKIYGDEGVLWTPDTWFYRSPVYTRKFIKIRRKMLLNPFKSRRKLLGTHLPTPKYRGASNMDYARGVAEIADAVSQKRDSRISGQFALHATELALAIHYARLGGPQVYTMRSTCAIPEPMPWAK